MRNHIKRTMTRLLDHFARARYGYLFLAIFLAACCVESIPATPFDHIWTGVLIMLWIGMCMWVAVAHRRGNR